jgi:2-polyprenyl-6-hydroxyphenyl methylase/3-demethylubiquinone-9 3-methyltransferase
MSASTSHPTASEIESSPDRFGFGANWSHFSARVDTERIEQARTSLSERLGDLNGVTFLDAGCGSGLFSLAAAGLGASRIHSFDYDPASVATAQLLKQRFGASETEWTIERGDVLDDTYVTALGQWDVVYSWGVLHHTGDMHHAWSNVEQAVTPGGRLFISIYNDQGRMSRVWTKVKQGYNRVPPNLRTLYVACVMAPREALSVFAQGPIAYLRGWRTYKRNRGMSRWHDLVDWVGGYPFEVATPEEVFEFFRARDFELEWLTTCRGSLGCNQFVFRRRHPAAT